MISKKALEAIVDVKVFKIHRFVGDILHYNGTTISYSELEEIAIPKANDMGYRIANDKFVWGNGKRIFLEDGRHVNTINYDNKTKSLLYAFQWVLNKSIELKDKK